MKYIPKTLEQAKPQPDSMWLVLVECRYEVIHVSIKGDGFFIPGQEPCWAFDHVAEWFHEIKVPIHPPEGKEWHVSVNNFPWDQMEQGERPLLYGEACEKGDLVFVNERWNDSVDVGHKMTHIHLPTKTKRPLP